MDSDLLLAEPLTLARRENRHGHQRADGGLPGARVHVPSGGGHVFSGHEPRSGRLTERTVDPVIDLGQPPGQLRGLLRDLLLGQQPIGQQVGQVVPPLAQLLPLGAQRVEVDGRGGQLGGVRPRSPRPGQVPDGTTTALGWSP